MTDYDDYDVLKDRTLKFKRYDIELKKLQDELVKEKLKLNKELDRVFQAKTSSVKRERIKFIQENYEEIYAVIGYGRSKYPCNYKDTQEFVAFFIREKHAKNYVPSNNGYEYEWSYEVQKVCPRDIDITELYMYFIS